MPLLVFAGIVVLLILFMLFSARPWQGKRWKIYTAKPEELHVVRTFGDSFSDTRDSMAFHLEYKTDGDGNRMEGDFRRIRVARHWVLMMEEE